MSDFIYSSDPKLDGILGSFIQSIYQTDPPPTFEFHGLWGSLAVSRNLYNGFQPLETDTNIIVMIGGPVLCYQENSFLTGDDPQFGTRSVYQRWQQQKMRWDEDLSGPFVVLIIDKVNGNVWCITDLMMFIPVYQYHHDQKFLLGTHVDALALAADCSKEFDPVSMVDFILHGAVTHPHTFYQKIRQSLPAAIHTHHKTNREGLCVDKPEQYWVPKETIGYQNINDAAVALREGLTNHLSSITSSMSHVAQFISGGEDSRALAGLLPQTLKRDAFIFLDNMNREGKIAQAIAETYGENYFVQMRKSTHYLDILPEAADLIGSGHQYIHSHSLGFHKICNLDSYPAVFGGYSSDTFIKAYFARRPRGHHRFPFLPEVVLPGETRSKKVNHPCFKMDLLSEISSRRLCHLRNVKEVRQHTNHEWFMLWPSTMRPAIPNIYCNRRLFRSYEVFLSKDVVKLCAAVPTRWKLNRRLFYKTMRPFYGPSRWISHSDGRFPYLPWWANMPVQFTVLSGRKMSKQFGAIQGDQGPWANWNQVTREEAWSSLFNKQEKWLDIIKGNLMVTGLGDLSSENRMNTRTKLNLLQTAYFLCKTQT